MSFNRRIIAVLLMVTYIEDQNVVLGNNQFEQLTARDLEVSLRSHPIMVIRSWQSDSKKLDEFSAI